MVEVSETSALTPTQVSYYAMRARKRNCQGLRWAVSAFVVTPASMTVGWLFV
jgi:hypothetical protein